MSDIDYVPGQRRMGAGAIIVIATLLSTAASVLVVYLLMERGLLHAGPVALVTVPVTEARVPDVVGMPAATADELLSARMLRMVVKEQATDARVPAGSVVSQAPLAQSRVSPNAEISVVISTGAAKHQVPVLVGQTLEAAKHAIEQAGLALGPLVESNEGEPGVVSASTPAAGTEVEPGAAIALTVAQPKTEVPKLLGLHIAKARDAIAQSKLTVGDISRIYDRHHRGYLVLTQHPDPGTRVALGSPIKLVVNQGD